MCHRELTATLNQVWKGFEDLQLLKMSNPFGQFRRGSCLLDICNYKGNIYVDVVLFDVHG